MKVVHFTSLHNRYDTRVFYKQCCHLAKEYDTTLIVADGKGNETLNNVKILDVGKLAGLKNRILKTNRKIKDLAISLDADIYQFHDPELNLVAKQLIKQGKKLVYDAHENAPVQILANGNYTLGARLKSVGIKYIENSTAKNLSAVVTATSEIADRYKEFNANVIVLRNYPLQSEFVALKQWELRKDVIVYVGGISKHRGIFEILKAIEDTEIKFLLAGIFQPSSLHDKLKQEKGWKNVEFLGMLPRLEVVKLLNSSKIGMLNLYPTPNHKISLPIKMFEYMLAGLATIYSDIPKWNTIMSEAKGGLKVDPYNVNSIKKAIHHLLDNQEEAKNLGLQARSAVLSNYIWENEVNNLLELYKQII